MVMTVWSLLAECISGLAEPFRRSEIIGWFRRHHPEVNEATLAAHIQAATVNATNRAQNNPLGTRPPLLRRVDHGLYVRAGEMPEPPARAQPQARPEQPVRSHGPRWSTLHRPPPPSWSATGVSRHTSTNRRGSVRSI